ncbi:hypothetical protein LSH36_2035g00000 [Paralvinella palmiformis]|uniref:Uncharacterized protein n=1 Tax=Paralvinella palmiformis TaxID=53620 RepID=A0AAD9IQI9_9ANNE|nr:hypothetical protein LSH36_2035g00000 [Paralvinella palmiformis]
MFAGKKIADRPKGPPLQLIGEDGTTYADLMIFNQLPVDPDKIHGIDNLLQYASIDFTKFKKETQFGVFILFENILDMMCYVIQNMLFRT